MDKPKSNSGQTSTSGDKSNNEKKSYPNSGDINKKMD